MVQLEQCPQRAKREPEQGLGFAVLVEAWERFGKSHLVLWESYVEKAGELRNESQHTSGLRGAGVNILEGGRS